MGAFRVSTCADGPCPALCPEAGGFGQRPLVDLGHGGRPRDRGRVPLLRGVEYSWGAFTLAGVAADSECIYVRGPQSESRVSP